jgi:uncharacterized protein (DUF885 family)
MIAGSGAAMLLALQACSKSSPAKAPDPKAQPAPGDRTARRTLAQMAEELLAEYPENAAALGLDKNRRVGLKAQLTDRSPEGNNRRAAATARRLAQLKAINLADISPEVALNVETTIAAHELADEGYRRFPFGDVALLNQYWNYRSTPYAVSQIAGAYVEIPDLLDSLHGVAGAEDAEAYLARLSAFAKQLDGETERLEEDAERGVIPPSFLIDTAARQMNGMLGQAPGKWGLVTSLQAKAEKAGLSADYGERAEKIIADSVAPALGRQAERLAELRSKANSRAGVWKLPDGDAYYRWALRAGTTTALSPDQIHQLGLEQVRSINAQMDGLLRSLGLTRGTVAARMEALGKDPKYLFPNTDEGRAQVLAYINERIADIRTRLPRAFSTLVKGNLVVKRVPPEIEAGAPGGYAGAGSVDGSVPGMYYINLKDTARWPRFALPTLTYHEGIPGHIWQGEYTYKLPLIRALLAFNAYSEGWALYSEQLADELGVYEGDTAGKLGYLQSLSFRACRLVVDTGLHAKRWTRDQAVQWFVDNNGSKPDSARSEVDRYCAMPGQACGYKVGHSEIVRLRDRARRQLGSRFDLAAFNDALVLGGSVPLTLLERVIDRYVEAVRAEPKQA